MQSTELREYVLTRVQKDAQTGCWLWKLAIDPNGYGFCGLRAHRDKAHRVSYSAFNGDLVPGMQIDHLCMVKRCVNPEHLEQVTPRENIRRAVQSRVGRHYTVYQVAESGIWRAAYTIHSSPRKRKVFSSLDRALAIANLEAWMDTNALPASGGDVCPSRERMNVMSGSCRGGNASG